MVLSGLRIWTKRTALATAHALKRSHAPTRTAAGTRVASARHEQASEANV